MSTETPVCHLHVGIEGGASNTKGILVDSTGKTLAKTDSKRGNSNHWQIGYDACVKLLLELIDDLLLKAGLPVECQLTSVGLSLSGVDSKENAEEISTLMHATRPGLLPAGTRVHVYGDCTAALETATNQGGR